MTSALFYIVLFTNINETHKHTQVKNPPPPPHVPQPLEDVSRFVKWCWEEEQVVFRSGAPQTRSR